MPYNPDPLVQHISKYISETESGLVFQLPELPFSIPVSEYEYELLTTRLTEASSTARMVNLCAAIGGLLFLLWSSLVRDAPFILAVPVWVALFIFGFFVNSFVLNRAFDPLRKRLITSWAEASGLPEPTFLSSVADTLRSHSAKLFAIAAIGIFLLLKAIFG